MGFNPPVPQQDSNWEIRVVLQASLILQILLIFVGPVADLALGLLLNNMGNFGIGGSSTSSIGLKRGGGNPTTGNSNSGSPIIFAFWTPFLLLHLGGPDTITAYSLEDNELWLRHLIGLLFELFSATVIFFSSLRSNPLIPATVLMFIVGIIKYSERTYSLYSGSVDGFRSIIMDPPVPGPNYAKLMTEFDAKEKTGLVVEIAIADGEASKAQKEAERREIMCKVSTDKSVEARAYDFFLVFRRLFVNLILSFKERRMSQAFFLELDDLKPSKAFEVIEVELNYIYDMVYTKAPIAHTRAGWVLRSICSSCLISALVIFFLLDKSGMKHVDIGITYALLLGGLALDAAALLMLLFSDRAAVFLEVHPSRFRWLGRLTRAVKRWHRKRRWSGMTSQMNLISYCLGKPDNYQGRRWWLKIAYKLGMEQKVDDLLFIRRVPLNKNKNKEEEEEPHLLKFIFDGLKDTAKNLTEKEEIMEVCNCRGNRVIDRYESDIKAVLGEEKLDMIRDTLVKSNFDESLLLWHVATDLSLLWEYTEAPPSEDTARLRSVSETLSEYMLYLLIKQPEMLSVTAGVGLLRYRDTCADVRQLSRGGELITHVWFLMAHMGLGDMYQIQEGDAKAKLIVHDQ
ncbi:hypothetical protein ACP70R_008858 [Stipagrostis hirtigluma subsp. patula]